MKICGSTVSWRLSWLNLLAPKKTKADDVFHSSKAVSDDRFRGRAHISSFNLTLHSTNAINAQQS